MYRPREPKLTQSTNCTYGRHMQLQTKPSSGLERTPPTWTTSSPYVTLILLLNLEQKSHAIHNTRRRSWRNPKSFGETFGQASSASLNGDATSTERRYSRSVPSSKTLVCAAGKRCLRTGRLSGFASSYLPTVQISSISTCETALFIRVFSRILHSSLSLSWISTSLQSFSIHEKT